MMERKGAEVKRGWIDSERLKKDVAVLGEMRHKVFKRTGRVLRSKDNMNSKMVATRDVLAWSDHQQDAKEDLMISDKCN